MNLPRRYNDELKIRLEIKKGLLIISRTIHIDERFI